MYPLYDLNSINECTAVSCCFISASWLSVCRSNGVGHLIHISALCITNRWSGPLSRRKVASGSGGPTAGARLGLGFSAQLNPYYLVIFNPSVGIDCCPSNANIICTYSYVLSPIRPIYIHIYLLLCYLLLYFLLRFFWAFKDHNKWDSRAAKLTSLGLRHQKAIYQIGHETGGKEKWKENRT